jgi:hypothetical protein
MSYRSAPRTSPLRYCFSCITSLTFAFNYSSSLNSERVIRGSALVCCARLSLDRFCRTNTFSCDWRSSRFPSAPLRYRHTSAMNTRRVKRAYSFAPHFFVFFPTCTPKAFSSGGSLPICIRDAAVSEDGQDVNGVSATPSAAYAELWPLLPSARSASALAGSQQYGPAPPARERRVSILAVTKILKNKKKLVQWYG